MCVCACVSPHRHSTLLYSTLLHPYPALLYSTTTALYPTPHPYSTLLYTLPLLHSTLYSAPTPLYPTLPLQHSSLLTQPQLHPTLLHPYSTLPLLHLARHLRRRAPQLRTLHTHYDTSDCCPVFPPSAVTLLHRCTVVVHAARRPVRPFSESTLLNPAPTPPYPTLPTATARHSTRPLDSSTLL